MFYMIFYRFNDIQLWLKLTWKLTELSCSPGISFVQSIYMINWTIEVDFKIFDVHNKSTVNLPGCRNGSGIAVRNKNKPNLIWLKSFLFADAYFAKHFEIWKHGAHLNELVL